MGKARSISRHPYSAAERERLVERYRQSQLTQAQFAQEHGLKLSALRQWLYRPNPPTAAPGRVFQEVLLAPPPLAPTWTAEVAVGEDLTLRFGSQSSPEFIAQVIDQLRRPC